MEAKEGIKALSWSLQNEVIWRILGNRKAQLNFFLKAHFGCRLETRLEESHCEDLETIQKAASVVQMKDGNDLDQSSFISKA